MRCEDLMTVEVGTVRVGEDVCAAARTMRELNVGFVPVCQGNGVVVGVLTDRDIAIRVVAEGRPPDTKVEDVMSEDLVACLPQADIGEAERLMRAYQVNRILLIDDDARLAGVISITDLAQVEDARKVGQVFGEISGREVGTH
jgi:CBS domain-containing protein